MLRACSGLHSEQKAARGEQQNGKGKPSSCLENQVRMQDMQMVIPGLFVSPRWSPQWETCRYRAMTEGIYKNSGNEVVLLFYEGMT